MIDVAGIKPAALLAALYNNSIPLGMGVLHYEPGRMSEEEAERLIAERAENGRAYFDYLKGRVMKVEVGGDALDPRLYDRDLGAGAAARVVASLRPRTAA
jgi:hypothetical protein